MTENRAEKRPVAAGDPAPAFRVPDHEGKPVASGDLRGRAYVLFFYPKADTPG
jgi:peroxiredoxin Q/BCP